MSVGVMVTSLHGIAVHRMGYFRCVGPYLVHSKCSRNVSCDPSGWILLKLLVRTTRKISSVAISPLIEGKLCYFCLNSLHYLERS